MRKKIAVFLVTAALALAYPLTALASGSPTDQSGTSGGVSISVNGATVGGRAINASDITVSKAADDPAIKAALPAGDDYIGCWEVELDGGEYSELSSGTVTLSFPVGANYNGGVATIIHDHDGNLTSSTCTVSGGTASITISQFSTFGVSVNTSGTAAASASSSSSSSPSSGSSFSNSSSSSPNTGTGNMTGLYVLTIAALVGAGAAFAFRKSTQR